MYCNSYASTQSASSSSHCKPSVKPDLCDGRLSYEMLMASPADFQKVPTTRQSASLTTTHKTREVGSNCCSWANLQAQSSISFSFLHSYCAIQRFGSKAKT